MQKTFQAMKNPNKIIIEICGGNIVRVFGQHEVSG